MKVYRKDKQLKCRIKIERFHLDFTTDLKTDTKFIEFLEGVIKDKLKDEWKDKFSLEITGIVEPLDDFYRLRRSNEIY